MNRRFLLLGALAYLLLLLGLGSLTGEVFALVIPLAVYMGAALLYAPRPARMSAFRTLSTGRVLPGTPIQVRLRVVNEGDRLEEVLIESSPPPSFRVTDGWTRALVTLSPGGAVELTYTLEGERASVTLGPVQVTVREHLGLLFCKMAVPAPAHLQILPQPVRLKRLAIRPLRTRAYAGPVPARQPGSGVEFFGVREYQPGDPLRWLNWKASGRHPHALFTNEFEQERIADVGLILDARRRSDVQFRADSLFEHAVRAAASLADMFLNEGNRVGLLVYGGVLDWTFPGYGRVQRERLMRALASARTGASLVFDRLDYLPTRFFPSRSQIVLISPLWRDDLPTLIRLRARGYQLLVVSPDPLAFEAERLPTQPSVETALRIARLERRFVLRRLRRAGVRVVDWDVQRPLGEALYAALGRVAARPMAVGWR